MFTKLVFKALKNRKRSGFAERQQFRFSDRYINSLHTGATHVKTMRTTVNEVSNNIIKVPDKLLLVEFGFFVFLLNSMSTLFCKNIVFPIEAEYSCEYF